MTAHADVLGVDESASEEEIQAAFRDQTRQFHPDKFDPERHDVANAEELNAEELFRDVKQARDALTEGGPSSASLNYDWDNGTPITATPQDDPPEQEVGPDSPDGEDESETGDSTGEETGTDDPSARSADGTDNDGPWHPGDEGDSADINETIGVNIGDGLTESISTENSRTGSTLLRRDVVTMAGVGVGSLIAAYWLGLFGSNTEPGDTADSNSEPDRTEDHLVVGPSDSLQDAADMIVSGGTLELEPGTYSQSLSIDVDMTITAPEGATLVGDEVDGTAITISASDVEIDGLTILDYSDGGIHGGDVETDLSISNVSVEDADDVGFELTGKQITLDEITVRNNEATGLQLTSSDTGSVSITNAVVINNKETGTLANEGHGVVVRGGEEVVIRDSEVTGSRYENIYIESESRDGQSVEMSDLFVANSARGSGIRIDGTRGEDDVTLQGIGLFDNDDGGIRLGSDSEITEVDLKGLTVGDNTGSGLVVDLSSAGTLQLIDSEFENNKETGVTAEEGHGVVVRGGEEVVIRDSEVTGSRYENIHIESGNADGQSVEMSDLFIADSARRSGIRIDGTREEDDVTLQGIELFDNDNGGIRIGEKNEINEVDLERLIVGDNTGSGLMVDLSSAGILQLVASEFENNKETGVTADKGHGVVVRGGEEVVLRDSEITASRYENIHIESGNADGQSVEMSDLFIADSARRSGIRIDGTRGEDNVTIEDSQSDDNSSYGFDLGGESIRIVDTDARGNDDGALNLRDIEREEAEIHNSFEESD